MMNDDDNLTHVRVLVASASSSNKQSSSNNTIKIK